MNFNRRTLLKQLALAGCGLAASRIIPSGVVKADARHLEMLVLGDSVIWGQGLKPENKFSHIVCKWLTEQTGRKINFHNEAHSGATIFPESDKGKVYEGEVNVSLRVSFNRLKIRSVFTKTGKNRKAEKPARNQ